MVHPEIGHILLNQDYTTDPFKGVCPYHQNCLEGLASGPSLAARWKLDAKMIPFNHPAWDLEAFYLGQALHTLVLTCSPQLVIMGGGVMDHTGLIEKVREAFSSSLNGYVQSPLLDNLESYIVLPKLGNRAGLLGAISLLEQ
jgi:fructokinase